MAGEKDKTIKSLEKQVKNLLKERETTKKDISNNRKLIRAKNKELKVLGVATEHDKNQIIAYEEIEATQQKIIDLRDKQIKTAEQLVRVGIQATAEKIHEILQLRNFLEGHYKIIDARDEEIRALEFMLARYMPEPSQDVRESIEENFARMMPSTMKICDTYEYDLDSGIRILQKDCPICGNNGMQVMHDDFYITDPNDKDKDIPAILTQCQECMAELSYPKKPNNPMMDIKQTEEGDEDES